MAASLKSLFSSVLGGSSNASNTISSSKKATSWSELFPKTDPATDGDECLRDCDSCSVRYPRGFKIDESDALFGQVSGWSTHVVVGTGKTDWVRDVADEKGSVMEAIARAEAPTNGRLMVSASDMPVPPRGGMGEGEEEDEQQQQTNDVLLLPAMTLVQGVHPRNVAVLLRELVSTAPTSESPLPPPPPPPPTSTVL
ncbi:hypothetical protein E4U55_008048, partial [Claviceps digitariae]